MKNKKIIILLILIILFNNLLYYSNTYKEGFNIEEEISKLINKTTKNFKGTPAEIIYTMSKDENDLGKKLGLVGQGFLVMTILIIVTLAIIVALLYFTFYPQIDPTRPLESIIPPIPMFIYKCGKAIYAFLMHPVKVYVHSNSNKKYENVCEI